MGKPVAWTEDEWNSFCRGTIIVKNDIEYDPLTDWYTVHKETIPLRMEIRYVSQQTRRRRKFTVVTSFGELTVPYIINAVSTLGPDYVYDKKSSRGCVHIKKYNEEI